MTEKNKTGQHSSNQKSSADQPSHKFKRNSRYKKRSPHHKGAQNKENNKNNSQDHAHHDKKRRNSRTKSRRPKVLSASKVEQKHSNLLDQFLKARKKYYSDWARPQTSPKAKEALERNMQQALFQLRQFESSLKDWQKESLSTDIYPLDQDYSLSHPQEKREEISFAGDFEDPHLNNTQIEIKKNALYSQDTEESTGTMEDYEKYKNQQ